MFLHALAQVKISHLDRAVALLWWYDLYADGSLRSAKELVKDLETAGYGKQNPSRLNAQLVKSNFTRKGPNGNFGIKITARIALTESYKPYVNYVPVPETDSVLPLDLFDNTRGYIENVVRQINASYDSGLYDCCAVMCRRLLETLIIETYESKGWADELKNGEGNFRMFSHMLSHIEREKRFSLGRNSIKGLKDFKRLGDLSAHDRRFNARKPDIDSVKNGLRVASEALLHEASLI